MIDSPSLSPEDVEKEFLLRETAAAAAEKEGEESTTTTTTTTRIKTTKTHTSALTPEEYNKIREMAREEEAVSSDEKSGIVREEVREIIGVAKDIAASAGSESTMTSTTTTTMSSAASSSSEKE